MNNTNKKQDSDTAFFEGQDQSPKESHSEL
jgi:hypothetical protein